jgi:HD superfamily phosphodiesterase
MTAKFDAQRVDEFMRRGYADHDEAHNYEHAQHVLENAVMIATKEGIDTTAHQNLITLIMLGHDLRDHKVVDMGRGLSEAEIRQFYTDMVGKDNAEMILHIHNNCSWSKRKTSIPLESDDWMRQLLQDADWIEAIGNVGIRRCIDYQHAAIPDLTDTDCKKYVCAHIREKLLLIPDELNFDATRELVDKMELIKPLFEYLEQFENPFMLNTRNF